ncbi:MAG: hypothetical protein KU37_07035 [Sulfuricurvum sp. PC08-66]|nr:MAG: hypothetical protein KU37_07035 [Sulfuricurvum sp. PC08-66]
MKKYPQLIIALHWTLALSVIVAFILHEFPQAKAAHLFFGALAMSVVVVRMGLFIGARGPHALGYFTFDVRALWRYVTDYKHYDETGRKNPAASYSAVALWVLVIAVGVVGMVVVGAKDGAGLFHALYTTDKSVIHGYKEIHEFLAQALMLVAVVHVLGVIVDRVVKGSATLAGMTRVQWSTPLLMVAGIVLLAWGFWAVLPQALQTNPIYRVDAKVVAPQMAQNCVECHIYYPPTMLPRDEWRAMMTNLEEHYGDDASVEEDSQAAMLAEYEAMTIDRVRFKEGRFNTSVTTTDYWKKEHKAFDEAYFKRHDLKKTQCQKCHIHIEENSYNTTLMPIKLWW